MFGGGMARAWGMTRCTKAGGIRGWAGKAAAGACIHHRSRLRQGCKFRHGDGVLDWHGQQLGYGLMLQACWRPHTSC